MPTRAPTPLRALRLARGLTAEALARAAGVHADTVHDLETGAPRVPRARTMKAIADALRVRITDVAEFVPVVGG